MQQRQGGEEGPGEDAKKSKTSPSTAAATSCVRRRRGAQPGNQLALKTGVHTRRIRELNAQVRDWRKNTKLLLAWTRTILAQRAMDGGRTRRAIPKP